jgi:hypothetical protein
VGEAQAGVTFELAARAIGLVARLGADVEPQDLGAADRGVEVLGREDAAQVGDRARLAWSPGCRGFGSLLTGPGT